MLAIQPVFPQYLPLDVKMGLGSSWLGVEWNGGVPLKSSSRCTEEESEAPEEGESTETVCLISSGSREASSPPGAPAVWGIGGWRWVQGCSEQACLQRKTRMCRAEAGGFGGLLVMGPRLWATVARVKDKQDRAQRVGPCRGEPGCLNGLYWYTVILMRFLWNFHRSG